MLHTFLMKTLKVLIVKILKSKFLALLAYQYK